jgi:ergothioneine biosynthesis protein EgtB
MLSLEYERKNLLKKFQESRLRTEYMCEPLHTEDYIIQASDFASPVKWMLGHVSWFYDNFILKPNITSYQPTNEKYYYLFNSYYLSSGIPYARTSRGTLSRPTVKEVFNYRHIIDEQIINFIENIDEQKYLELIPLMNLGINHEQQHQELFYTDLKYNFGVNPLFPEYKPANTFLTPNNSMPDLKYVGFSGGLVNIGYNGNGFFFDNEKPVHKTYLQDFKLANRLITNREYLEFIEDDGYSNHKYWLSDGWSHITREKWKYPLYWIDQNGEFYAFKLYGGLQKLNLDEPVTHVSYYEADAFAKWSGKRLPTEFEWEHAARHSYYPLTYGPFADDETLHPLSIRKEEIDDPKVKLYQLFGNTWEWTSSHYQPYPGYTQIADGVGEYNGKFMNNQYVLRGGSIATPRNHLRIEYRNFFYPHERWQFTGIRLADLL